MLRAGLTEVLVTGIDISKPLPRDIVELAPEYEGYDYVVVNDEIVFVQPSTRKVVGMMVAGGEDSERHLAGARPCPVD